MATGSITTLPARPEDGGGAFPPGHFKDPKRLYCKNGGFFLRIHPDGSVDGAREKSDPHGECGSAQLPPPGPPTLGTSGPPSPAPFPPSQPAVPPL
ncbi:PREDICTED: fibroblast growth factor 2 [Condylura cristata]|uniref:fibroblast growth factor 2 n=1 Tax=Condylura cristata TaxID=143302 RepID=UPI0003346FE0|nr:PREDICTED: fibroblast growth factor 2 [Condylura cristata]